MNLALGMIVRNEERMLRLTQSVPFHTLYRYKFAVDTGSTDGTVEFLRESGWNVLSKPWENDYARARNQLLEFASSSLTPGSDWLLMLDADEAIWAYETIPLCIHCKKTSSDLISLPRINLAGANADIQEVGSYPDAQSRCIRIGSPVRFKLPVHEVANQEAEFFPGAHIYHYGWVKSPTENWLRSHNYRMISEGKPTLAEAPDWVKEISDKEYWDGMRERHKFAPFNDPHPLKGVI